MRDIKGYAGWYAIGTDGRVFSRKTNSFLKPRDSRGYKKVVLIDFEGKSRGFRIHRLVAMAYLDNPHNYPEVNHKDYDKGNNHVSNLEWCTRQQNVNHAMKRIREKKEDHSLVDKLLGRGASVREIAEATKMPVSKILKIKYSLN